MNTLHHLLSQIASFGLVFSLLYTVMEYTIGFVPYLRRWKLFGNIPGRSMIFSISSLLLIMGFVSFP